MELFMELFIELWQESVLKELKSSPTEGSSQKLSRLVPEHLACFNQHLRRFCPRIFLPVAATANRDITCLINKKQMLPISN